MLLGVPVVASEQYPQGLGHTVPPIAALFPEGALLEKTSFSCMGEPEFVERMDSLGRPQCIVAGIEAHVCVLQTCMELLERGRRVFVVADATASRTPFSHQAAMTRLTAAGTQVVTTEMVCFEWMVRSDHEAFREVSGLVK